MARILNLFPWRRRRSEEDLDRELRYHIERRVDDLKRSGLGDAEARRQTALELGGVAQVKEEVRDTWVWRWLGEGMRDLRYTARTLARSPGIHGRGSADAGHGDRSEHGTLQRTPAGCAR